MVDIRRERHGETQGTGTRLARAGTGAGDAEGRRRTHSGRVRPSSSWLPELLWPGKAQNTGATESVLLWSTQKLELHAKQGMLHIEQPGA